MRSSQRRFGLIAGAVLVAALVTGFLVHEGLDRADKWASVAGGGIAVAGLLAGALRRPATGGGDATFTGAPLSAPAPVGTPAIRGRDRELRRLARAARRPDGAVHVLTGMGGVGKSFLAAWVCRWYARREGRAAWWIAAQDQAGLVDGLVSLAEAHGLGEVQVTAIRNGAPRAVERLWELLRQAPQRWLLVFDNLDDPRLAAGLIQSGVAGCADRGLVLVTSRTSRRQLWGRDADVVELGPLAAADSAQVLLDLARDAGARAAAERLARDLGCLPLALRLAGANLNSPFPIWHTFDGYRDALRELGVDRVLAAPGAAGEPVEHRANVMLTWQMSVSALEGHGLPYGRPLLQVLSHFAPGVPVPETLLHADPVRALLGGDGAAGRDALHVRRVVQRNLEGLADQSLITAVAAVAPDRSRLFMLHPVVAETNRVGSPGRSAPAGVAVALVAAAVAALRFDDNAHWAWFGLFAPHVEELLRSAGTLTDEDLATLITTVSRVVAADTWRGHDADAEALAVRALPHADRLGATHEALLALRHERAWAVGRLGRWAEAHAELSQVCQARTSGLGAGHPDTLDTRHKLAWATGRLGDWRAAESLLQAVQLARVAALGEEHADTLHTRCCLAWAIGRCGRPDEAERRYTGVIAARERVLGADHAESLDARHSLAELYVLCGRFAAAEEELQRLVADRRRVLGAGHPETLDTRPRYWLGRALLGQGRRREAQRVLRALADDQIRYLGPDHPATAETVTLLRSR
ncbi:tetratricopeptide repeat protein [Dactylosporangium aurantiacum]|uniref:Tetratricopeptide repeat protein n=1 Tax=Dactylosporangium aurantiacum TaxID=35754 RepID=A0A9Q9IAQ3_9ACTN|nr:tetratricopeptide repeat protein [Dactylosporangium aurantiacum]MDG6106684.1 tetratricopeptide repeat protein [Dactylosporangium aurantiacum]UWZ50838.1 tetratricopeptide repeat protein [Dactylosporangium aurantiacum]